MTVPCNVIVLLNNWISVLIADIIIVIGCVTFYLVFFMKSITSCIFTWSTKILVELFITCFGMMGCCSYCVIFFYVYEKGFRKLHFLEQEIQTVFFYFTIKKRIN